MINFRSANGSNDLSAKLSFETRKFYKDSVYPEQTAASPVDFWYSTHLYGKVDRQSDAVYLLEDGTLKPLNADSALFAVDFVVDAFNDFRQYYRDLIKTRRILPYANLEDLRPARAWRSAEQLYSQYIEGIQNFFVNSYMLQHKQEIETFDDFVSVFKKYMQQNGSIRPVTRTGFVLSNLCPTSVGGLTIEIMSGDHSEDLKKAELLNDQMFLFFSKAAELHGFFVNKNAPWSLTARLGSTKMQQRAVPYGITKEPGSASDFFEKYHTKTRFDDIDDLRSLLFDSYNSFVISNPFIKQTEVCQSKSIHRVKKRKQLSKLALNRNYPQSFWFELYLNVRLIEISAEMTEQDKIRLIKKVNSQLTFEQGIDMIANKIKTLDTRRQT